MKTFVAVATLSALIGFSGNADAAALLFQFDNAHSSVAVTENGRLCLPFAGCKLSAAYQPLGDVSIDAGDSATFDFAKFKVSSGFGGDSDARIDAVLAFTSPVSDTASSGATISYLRLGGFFTPGVVAGSVVWDDPIQQFTTDDGSLFTVSFNDLNGLVFGSNAYGTVTISVDRIGPPDDHTGVPGVPEPASWAMMLGGFGLVGSALRGSRKPSVRFA